MSIYNTQSFEVVLKLSKPLHLLPFALICLLGYHASYINMHILIGGLVASATRACMLYVSPIGALVSHTIKKMYSRVNI